MRGEASAKLARFQLRDVAVPLSQWRTLISCCAFIACRANFNQ
jgi:hypothetical protein